LAAAERTAVETQLAKLITDYGNVNYFQQEIGI